MTRKEFQNHCEDIATEESNEDWNRNAILDAIRGQIGTVVIDFNSDSDSTAGESNV